MVFDVYARRQAEMRDSALLSTLRATGSYVPEWLQQRSCRTFTRVWVSRPADLDTRVFGEDFEWIPFSPRPNESKFTRNVS